MNHKDAPVAELQGRIRIGMAAVTLTATHPGKCIRPYALSAARRLKYPLNHRTIGQSFVRTAISPENAVETDIDSTLAPAHFGRGFLLTLNIPEASRSSPDFTFPAINVILSVHNVIYTIQLFGLRGSRMALLFLFPLCSVILASITNVPQVPLYSCVFSSQLLS